MVNFDDYKVTLQEAMKEVCDECRLFPNSIQCNPTSTSQKMTGYKIQIFEEDYPASPDVPHEKRTGILDSFGIALIKEITDPKDKHYGSLLVSIRSILKPLYQLPHDSELTSAPEDYFGFYISPDSSELMPYLKELMRYRVKNYWSSNNSFGCCSSFMECSDAKQCVHSNLLYATGCQYRMRHLEKGEIFYGKNRNID